jgi:hypothetical protein
MQELYSPGNREAIKVYQKKYHKCGVAATKNSTVPL